MVRAPCSERAIHTPQAAGIILQGRVEKVSWHGFLPEKFRMGCMIGGSPKEVGRAID